MIKRYPWDNFPPIWIHANESSVKQHPAYCAAKSGDPDAAYQLVNTQLNSAIIKLSYHWTISHSVRHTQTRASIRPCRRRLRCQRYT